MGQARPLVFVCTANVCRSPLAERVVRARLADRGWLASAGTRATDGQPMCGVSASLLQPAESAPGGHVARQPANVIPSASPRRAWGHLRAAAH